MLYTYSKCILLAIWQVLYPLGCFKTLYGFTECKINEWMNEKVVRGRGHSSGMEQTANIKFCFKLGKTAAETLELMRQVYGDNCLSCAQTEVTIERAPVWRCSRLPSSCDIESSGHTTRRLARVLPVFAGSCHSLYRCRRDVLWIKYR